MKINNISNLNFGYSKEYSKKFDEILSNKKRNKEMANYLILLNNYANNLEDSIVEMEKTPNKTKTYKFADMVSMLQEVRDIIATYISCFFPGIFYGDDLAKQYKIEAGEQKNDSSKQWRLSVSEYIGGLDSADNLPSRKISSDDFFEKLFSSPEEKIDSFKQGYCKYIQKYIPTISSPKGFQDVVGMDKVKERLKEEIIDPISNPEQAKIDFDEYNIVLPKGYIFYGPPGCGKTYIAKALAAESGLDMYLMDVSKIGSKFINETSNNVESTFRFLKDEAKRIQKPVLLFMDEVDSLAMSRKFNLGSSGENEKTVSTLLKLVEDARDNNIIIIAATNRYDDLDEAFKSRFDGHVYFSLSDGAQIKNLLKSLLSSRKKGLNLAQSDEQLEILSKMLIGYSNRSITFFVDEASKLARKNNRRDITFEDVKDVINNSEYEKVNENSYKKSNNRKTIGFA